MFSYLNYSIRTSSYTPSISDTPCLITERLLDAEELFDMVLEDVDVYRSKDPLLSGLSAVSELIDRVDMCFRFMEGSDLLDESKFETIQLVKKRLSDIHGNLLDDTLDGFWEDEGDASLEEWLRSTSLLPHRDPGKPLIGSGNDSVVLKRMVADRIGQLQSAGPLEFSKNSSWKLFERIEICDRYLREHDADSRILNLISDDIFKLVNLSECHKVMAYWEAIDFKTWILKCQVPIASVPRRIYSGIEIQQARLSYEEYWDKVVSSAPQNFFPSVMTEMYPPLPFIEFSKRLSLSPLSVSKDDNTVITRTYPSDEHERVNEIPSPNMSNKTSCEPPFPSRKVIVRPLPAHVANPRLKGQPLLLKPPENMAIPEQNILTDSSPKPLLSAPQKLDRGSEILESSPSSVKTQPLLPTPEGSYNELLTLAKAKHICSFVIPSFSQIRANKRSQNFPRIREKRMKIDNIKLKLFGCLRWLRRQFEKDLTANNLSKIPKSDPFYPFVEIRVPPELMAKLQCDILSCLSAAFNVLDDRRKSVSLSTVIKNLIHLKSSLKHTNESFLLALSNLVKTAIEVDYEYDDCNKIKLIDDYTKQPDKIVRSIKRSLVELIIWVKRFNYDDELINAKFETSRIEQLFKKILKLCCCNKLLASLASSKNLSSKKM